MSRGRGPRGGRTARAGAALLAVLASVVLAAAPAHAAGYRFWSFWTFRGSGSSGWTYAQAGPAQTTPADGSVEGWRFAVSDDSSAAVRPRGAPDFAAICGRVPARAGHKRIALVVDPGTAADAPDGAAPPAARTGCASVPDGASAADALAAVAAPLRYASSGLVCAVDGYPASGCAEQVAGGGRGSTAAAAAPARAAGSGGGSPSVGLYAGAGVVVVLGAGAVWQARRRRVR